MRVRDVGTMRVKRGGMKSPSARGNEDGFRTVVDLVETDGEAPGLGCSSSVAQWADGNVGALPAECPDAHEER